MKIAAAYVRVSTEKQDEYSLDSQLKLIRDYAAQRDLIVPEEFVFVEDGVSGRSAKKRPEFQRMIALAKEKEPPFSVILVWKFSRFARNQEESIFYKSMLARSGVEVTSISETLDDSPFSSLIERIIEWMDEFYSIRLSGEVKRGMMEKFSRGEVLSKPPFGYSLVNRQYVPDDNAPYVQRIFRDFVQGKGMVSIAAELNNEGVLNGRGNTFDNRLVRYILANPTYIGKIRWSSDGRVDYRFGMAGENALLIDGSFEPLIDLETWEAAQRKLELLRSRRPYTRHDQPVEWMLKGLLICSNCGATLVGNSRQVKSVQCHRYTHGKCAVSHHLYMSKANAALIAALEHCISSELFTLAPPVKKAAAPGKDYKKLIAAEELKLRRVLAAYEAGVDTLEEYAAKKKKLQAAIESLQAEQAAEAQASRSVPVAEMKAKTLAVLALIKSPDVSEAAKNAALRSILSHIVYEKAEGRLALYFSFN